MIERIIAWLQRRLYPRPIGTRTGLPPRRAGETIKFEHSGQKWFATISCFPGTNHIAEIFVTTAKSGDLIRALASDAAIAASLALQYGCPSEVLRTALSRDTGGEPQTPLAAALDLHAGVIIKPEDGTVRGTQPILKEKRELPS